jgi:ribosomal protein L32E
MVTPAVKHTIIKKRTAHFKRHQSNRFMRVGVSVFNNIEKYIFTNFALK